MSEERRNEGAERFRLTPLDANMAIKRIEEKVDEVLGVATVLGEAVRKIEEKVRRERRRKKDVLSEIILFAAAVYLLHSVFSERRPVVVVRKREEEED